MNVIVIITLVVALICIIAVVAFSVTINKQWSEFCNELTDEWNDVCISQREELIELIGERLTAPGEGVEVGPTLGMNKLILQGLFFAPSVVASSLKTSVLTSYALEKLGYKVSPRYNEPRADIVELIYFNNKEELIKYAQGIQESGAIDSHVKPVPSPMPGYDDDIIMASPSFTQGSSIELSCDAPLRKPYVLFQQGSLTYEYGRLGVLNAINKLKE